jgi:hypothetical protein
VAKAMKFWDNNYDYYRAGGKFNKPISEFQWMVYHKYWKPKASSGWKNLGRRYTSVSGHVSGRRY